MADTVAVPGYPEFSADENGDLWCNGRRLGGCYGGDGQVWIVGVPRAVLVCAAFHGPAPGPDATVTHLDGVNDNDRPDNLAWS